MTKQIKVAFGNYAKAPKTVCKCVIYPDMRHCGGTSNVKYKFRYEFNHIFVRLLNIPVILHMTLRYGNVCQDES
jgi:hypothetical protein